MTTATCLHPRSCRRPITWAWDGKLYLLWEHTMCGMRWEPIKDEALQAAWLIGGLQAVADMPEAECRLDYEDDRQVSVKDALKKLGV